jgi:hypothetical protein
VKELKWVFMNTIRAIAFKSGDFWVAQCLEHDLAALTVRLNELPNELSRVLALHIEASRQNGIEPFAGFPEAPQRFWQMFEASRSRLLPVAERDSQDPLEIETRIAA